MPGLLHLPLGQSQISFFNTVASPGAVTSAAYSFSLSTSSQAVDGLSSTLADNVGPDSAAFFSGVLSETIPGGILTITGSPFVDNPANGNLLLDILISGQPTAEAAITVFMDESDGSAGTTGRALVIDGVGSVNGPGLITGFTFDAAGGSVPEPGTWGLLGAGLVALRVVTRRRKQRSEGI